MKAIRVAAASLNQTPLDWEGNARRIASAIEEAKGCEASLLCLPELCITGYGCEDAFLSLGVEQRARRVLSELLPLTAGLVVCFGLPLALDKSLYNTSCLVADGRLLGFVAKRVLAGDGVHYEPRWFKPWPAGVRVPIEFEGLEVPLGDVHFEVGGVRIGFEICEDAWTAERPAAELALDAVDIILNPSASHFAFGKASIRRRLVLEGARAYGVHYVYANLLGNEAGRIVYDGDAQIAAGGEIAAASRRFSFCDVVLASAVLDVELVRTRRGVQSSMRSRPELRAARVQARFAWPDLDPSPHASALAPWESSESVRHEEFTRAVALGLFDYLRKSSAQGFVVSLSGGADSSAVACLVSLMVRLARAELGGEGFRARLAHIRALEQAEDDAACTAAILTTVYQSTRHSSKVTRSAAREVATAIGATHIEIDVDELVVRYESLVEGALGRRLDWSTDDAARQNIQARVRAPGVWLIANLKGALLLATSNRSEAAVGYATMDGDTAGGFSPIAGVDKAFLRRWLLWLQKEGPEGIGPISALSCVNAQAPTAELRPADAGQTDEADLMPYVVLDAVERAAIFDKRSPLDVYRLLRVRFPELSGEQLHAWIERFFLLWTKNQWKRERYAPSLHLDDANLDPKTWCRFPILSGGYTQELAELSEAIREPAVTKRVVDDGD